LPSTPLLIAEVKPSPDSGLIGITFAPGKKGPSLRGGYHDRDINADLDVIAAWGAAAVVTLVEEPELHGLEIWELEAEVRGGFMEWHHLPIRDVSIPDAAFERSWPANAARLHALIDAGANELIHCRGGRGRAGMVAARLLVERDADPDEAMRDVRAVRPGAIETPDQEDWVRQEQGRGSGAGKRFGCDKGPCRGRPRGARRRRCGGNDDRVLAQAGLRHLRRRRIVAGAEACQNLPKERYAMKDDSICICWTGYLT
jgi:protein-tyrosine phosphatase